jgi:MFS superfamily sulfate permease-like transporter
MSGPDKHNFSVSSTLRADLAAGLVVFLVALPLCLGIALASGAPLFAGVIAGIVGGTVVAVLSGSPISVSGPAAGLAVIVANAIQQLGSYPVFLAAVVIAGAIQILLGLMRLGLIGDYVPSSVIKGMLAGIGTVIVLKQIPHALGRDVDYEGDFSFFEQAGANTLTDIATALASASAAAVIISGLSLAVLLIWERPELRRIRPLAALPGPLVVVILGITLNEAFRFFAPEFALTAEEHLVRLPVSSGLVGFVAQFTSPDWTAFARPEVYMVAVTLAIVASIESLLSIEAADKLDPYKRITPTNRELIAQGIGNSVSGLIGGLPLTSVVVRTSANVYAGAKTKASSFTHGVLLLVAALTIPAWLNKTPLACLAAILLLIGYKLARPQLFRSMWRAGLDQFLPFVVTVTAIVFTDLLKGVLIGFAVGLFFVIRANHREPFTVVHKDGNYLVRFNKDVTFVNKSSLKNILRKIPDASHVVIDASRSLYIDKDIYEVLEEFRQLAYFRNIDLELKDVIPAGEVPNETIAKVAP